MKTKIFDKGLYKEGLRQTKVIGLLALIISEIAVCICFALNLTSALASTSIDNYSQYNMFSYETAEFSMMNPLLLFICLVCAVLLPLYLFGFLNKRNQSDFYHSLPHKRTTVSCSFLASIFTWILLTILVTSVTAISLYGLFLNKYYTFHFASYLNYLLSVISIVVLLVGSFTIGMSITGTTITNIFVTTLIVIVPRALINLICVIVEQNPIADIKHLPFPFGNTNLLFNGICSLFINVNYYDIVSILYTLGLGLIYIVLGVYLLNKRKSETAGLSAPSKKIQGVFRVLVTFMISLIATLLICTHILSGCGIDIESAIWYFTIYIVAIIAFFIYELITTRSTRTILKIIPSLLIVVVLNVAFAFTSITIYHSINNKTPEAKEIKSISIREDKSNSLWDDSYSTNFFDNNYYSAQLKTIALSSDTSKELVSQVLKNNIKSYSISQDVSSLKYTVNVKINLKNGSSLYRKLGFTTEQYNTLKQELLNSQNFIDLVFNLPKLDNVKTKVVANSNYFTKDEVAKLYKTLQKDLKTIDKQVWLQAIMNETTDNDVIGILSMYSYIGFDDVSVDLPIIPELKETSDLYIKLLHESCTNTEWVSFMQNDLEKDEINDISFNIRKIGFDKPEDNIFFNELPSMMNHLDEYYPVRNTFVDWIISSYKKPVDTNKPYLIIHLDINTVGGIYTSVEIPINVTKKELSILDAWYSKTINVYDEEQCYVG